MVSHILSAPLPLHCWWWGQQWLPLLPSVQNCLETGERRRGHEREGDMEEEEKEVDIQQCAAMRYIHV